MTITSIALPRLGAAPPAPAPAANLPVPAERYQGSVPPHTRVRGADLATYRRVYGAMGAANATLTSYVVFIKGLKVAGVILGHHVGRAISGGHHLGGTIGAVVGGLAGIGAATLLQNKTVGWRKVSGRVGGAIGDGLGRLAHLAHVPLRSDKIETTRDYTWKGMTSHLGHPEYSSHPTISPADANAFAAKLQVGDVILGTREEASFQSIMLHQLSGKTDFNNAAMYVGNGQVIHMNERTVREGPLQNFLQTQHHVVAVRPQYQAGQAAAAAANARMAIGAASGKGLKEVSMGAAIVGTAVRTAAPHMQFDNPTPLAMPFDLLHTSDADVVAEAGADSSLYNSYLARFV